MPLARRLLRALRLPPAEVARAAEAAALFWAYRAALRVVPVRRLLGPPGPPDEARARPEAVPPPVVAVAQALRRASAGWPDTCLAQALAGRAMLRRRGLPSTLTLGARRDADARALVFHAWLRAGGVVLNPGGGPRSHAVLSTFHDPGR